MHEKSLKKSYLIALSCFITLTYFSFLYWVTGFAYAVNDDRFARDILSGAYSGIPDGHIEHIRYLLCLPIVFLYQIQKNVDWYGLSMLVMQGICVALILYRIGSFARSKLELSIYWLFSIELVTVLWLSEIVFFTYTVIAGVLAATAVFWYLTGEDTWKTWIVCTILACMAYMLRDDNFIMAVPTAAGAFLYKQVMRNEKINLKMFRFPALLCISLLVIIGMNKLAYNSDIWNRYMEYDKYRIDIYDYYKFPDYVEYNDFYESVGLNENDYATLKRYGLALNEEFTPELFEVLQGKAKEVYGSQRTFLQRGKDGLKELYHQVFAERYQPLSYVAIAIWLFIGLYIIVKKRKNLGWCYLAFVCLMSTVWLYAGFRRRFPDRIGQSLFILLFMAGLGLWLAQKVEVKWNKIMVSAGILICIPAMCTTVMTMRREVAGNVEFNQDYNKLVDYFQENEENFYFVDVDSISRFTGEFKVNTPNEYLNYMSLGDWTCFMSPYYDKLEREEIENVRNSILTSDNIYVVAKDYFDLEYVTNGYSEEVTYEIVDKIPMNGYEFYVYQYRLLPEGEVRLNNEHIVGATASINEDLVEFALDGNPTTRWNGRQEAGIMFQVKLDDIYPVCRISPTMGQWTTDYLRGLTIETSVDGVHWEKQILEGDGIVNVSFPTVECQWIRIYRSESAGEEGLGMDWAIGDLKIYIRES